MLDEYEINSSTLAITPIDSKSSRVYEEDTEYVVNKSVHKIIDYNCKFYGSSYKGRCEGTKYLTGIKSKFPIVVEESRGMIFFPTCSNRNEENSWISLNHIKKYKDNLIGTTISFDNEKDIDMPISFYSLDNQYVRANLLKAKMYDRTLRKVE